MSEYKLQNDEFHDVSGFEIIGDYTLKIRFDDDSEQFINFEPMLYGPLFEPLRELEVFNQVKLNSDIGTLVWPTGADIDPNILYDWPNHVEAIVARRRKQFAAVSHA